MTMVTFAALPACAMAAVGGWYRPPHRWSGLRRRPDPVHSLSLRHAAGSRRRQPLGGGVRRLGHRAGRALASTAVLVVRRSSFAEVTATITGSLLVCDACLTSQPRAFRHIAQVVASAPVDRATTRSCLLLEGSEPRSRGRRSPLLPAAGFTIADNKLVPPKSRAPATGLSNTPPRIARAKTTKASNRS